MTKKIAYIACVILGAGLVFSCAESGDGDAQNSDTTVHDAAASDSVFVPPCQYDNADDCAADSECKWFIKSCPGVSPEEGLCVDMEMHPVAPICD